MLIPDFNSYRQEKKLWKSAGEPIRTDERVVELYEICAACEHYIPLPIADRGQCGVCTCLLSKDADRMNKLRWATTSCPIQKWEAEIKIEAGQINDQPPSTPPCGCQS